MRKCLFCDNEVLPDEIVCVECIHSFHRGKARGIKKIEVTDITGDAIENLCYMVLRSCVHDYQRALRYVINHKYEAKKPRKMRRYMYTYSLSEMRISGEYLINNSLMTRRNGIKIVREITRRVVSGEELDSDS